MTEDFKELLNQRRKKIMELEETLAENKDKIATYINKMFLEMKTSEDWKELQKEVGEAEKVNAEIKEKILKERKAIESLEAMSKVTNIEEGKPKKFDVWYCHTWLMELKSAVNLALRHLERVPEYAELPTDVEFQEELFFLINQVVRVGERLEESRDTLSELIPTIRKD